MTAKRIAPIAAIIARAETFMRSGAISAFQCGPSPKTERVARNRGKGAAIQWLCEHVGYNEKRCLFWPFSKNGGYPNLVGHLGKVYKPARLMCLLAHGAPPSDQHQACHTCGRGNKGCINPLHLTWRTRTEARLHEVSIGLRKHNRQGKITHEAAEEIRSSKGVRTAAELAKTFGLSPNRIVEIWKGRAYARRVKSWTLRDDGRFYSRIVFNGHTYSLGGFKTGDEASAAYYSALARLRRGESAKIETPDKFNDLRRFHTRPTVLFGNDGERVVAVEPEQTQFMMHGALTGLHPQVQKFILTASQTGDLDEAAAAAGLSDAQVATILPRLKAFLGPMLR
jgi:hypothetical protein